jgi:DNA-binding GntR family transcriptional regulator
MTSGADMYPIRLSTTQTKHEAVTSAKTAEKRKVSLSDQAYWSIKNAIITGQLRSNERLIEQTIAADIGTSRAPVREALLKLEKEDLVLRLPKAGFAVKEIAEEEVEDVLELQGLLEGCATRLAALKITENEMCSLNDLISLQEGCLTDGDVKTFIRLDAEFHDAIHRATKNARLYDLIQSLKDYIDRYRAIVFRSHANLHLSIKDHKELMAMMRERNAAEIEKLAGKHLIRANSFIRKRIRWARASDDRLAKEEKRSNVTTRTHQRQGVQRTEIPGKRGCTFTDKQE